MTISDNEMVQEFLVESYENLDRLDRELVSLEREPQNRDALAGVFRTIHTIKGTCGFLGFGKLEKVAHAGENLLSLLRDGKMILNPEITTVLLNMVDAIRQILSAIKATGREGDRDYSQLLENLKQLQNSGVASTADVPSRSQPIQPIAIKLEQDTPAAQREPVPPPAKAETQSTTSAGPSETIRVGVNLLDNLMTLVGELVLARNQLLQYSNSVENTNLQAVSQRLNLIATELQEEVMKTRMQPIGNVWGQFPRTVRDVALGCGKEVVIEMEGKETELDKTIIEAIKDPLTHLVRNAVDHGIELPEVRVKAGKTRAGRLILRAFHEGGQVNIEISDDGAGLNRERIKQKAIERGLVTPEHASRLTEREISNLIFLPGFSTADKVTNVSGRGVGMDVVKTNVEKIGGTVDVQSAVGGGTTVRVKIPLTLAIIPALVISCAGERYAIPQVSLLELVRLEAEQALTKIELVHGAPVYRLRERLLPLIYLKDELKVASKEQKDDADDPVHIVVLQADGQPFGLVVDEINDTEEIVVKPLGKQIKGIKTFAGASIMGDGRVALILDVMGVAQRANAVAQAKDHAAADQVLQSSKAQERKSFLLFTGPDEAHMAVPLDTLARLEEFPSSQIERSGTQLVTQYRGQILPLVNLEFALEERRRRRRHQKPVPNSSSDVRVQVLVCNQKGQRVGVIVERIVDIVEENAEVKYPATRAGVLYSAVIQGHVTELMDITNIVENAGIEMLLEEQQAEVSK